MMLDGG